MPVFDWPATGSCSIGFAGWAPHSAVSGRTIVSRAGLPASRDAYDIDVLRQPLTLAFLRSQVPAVLSKRATACVIGDGFATMTSLVLASEAAGRVVLVNLTKTLLVDLWYLRLWMGVERFEAEVRLVSSPGELMDMTAGEPGNPSVVAVQAAHQHLLEEANFDLAINIASMQEMNPESIARYFAGIRRVAARRPVLFYCCNRVEKRLPDGTAVRFSEYPWQENDVVLVDELCPWHQSWYTLRPPSYRPYDGPIQHRLVRMAAG